MLNLPVDLELGDVIDGGFNPEHQTEFVVHLDGGVLHLMLDSRTENSGIEVIPHFPLIQGMQLLPEKRGDILRFDGVHGGPNQRFIDVLQVFRGGKK